MNRKSIKYSFAVILVIITGAVLFAFREYNRKHVDIKNREISYIIKSDEIINAFSTDEISANKLYLDKVVAVEGKIKSIEKGEVGFCAIVLGEKKSLASIRCIVDSTHLDATNTLREGDQITMKGICTGFNADELLGADVILNRCIIKTH
jgi:hypothetical protein